MNDITPMRAALALAARGLGATWPNPSVGCVIVNAGRVVGRGRTGLRGRPHAETEALAMAGAAARGATAYVTLEPCSHHGQTPPCADALVAAGIARVVVAACDPDPRVNGAGLARLRAGGIAVEQGFLAGEAEETLAGFFARVRLGRPLVTLKLASTLDGRIATRTGESRWITGPAARRAVQALRGRHDAVMVGVGTLLADDPDLTCRLPGYAHRPTVRVVADSRLRTPPGAGLVRTAHRNPSWILYHTDGLPDGVSAADARPGEILASRAQILAEAGARCIPVPPGEGGIDPEAALRALGTRGLTRVLVEGGARLAASLLRHDLVDRLVWFHAPGLIGGDGLPALDSLDIDRLAELGRFARIGDGPHAAGADMMTELARIG
jgi:diaminohydroxyphosphoribosylaminopyrimidine deaminase/5-amino-6-(5-phosphoribosylamino)uracil reductase